MDNKYPFHSNCGCLNSDSDAALKIFTDETSQDLQRSDYYNQTNLHNLSDPDSLKKIIISKESIHALRLNTLQKRIVITLSGIQLLLSNGPQPDGVEDLKRRQQRAAEFSSRFCRNYLYQLQRQINNITKMWKSLSNNHSHASYFVLCQKVITAHQNAHLALQAYLHHMPCSVERGIPDKLEEILQVVNDLCSFCSKLGMSEGDTNMKVVKDLGEQLMMQMKSKEAEKWEGSSTSLPQSSGQKGSKPYSKKEMIPYRLSMYSGNTLEKPPSNQNKKASKTCVGLAKRPSKTQCNKCNVKDINVMTKMKPSTAVVKNTPFSTYGCNQEGKQFGEVSSGDNVRTMIECLLADEPLQSSDVPTTPSTNMTTPDLAIVEHREEKSLHSYKKTLRKLESEISNLKEQTQTLKENGHPNYSIYINMLETMFRQLSHMKSQKHDEDSVPNLVCETSENTESKEVPLMRIPTGVLEPSDTGQVNLTGTSTREPKYSEVSENKHHPQIDNTPSNDDSIITLLEKNKQLTEKKLSSEYPKNVKLVCLTSKEDKEMSENNRKLHSQPTVIAIHNAPKLPDNKNNTLLLPVTAQDITTSNTSLQTSKNWEPNTVGRLYKDKSDVLSVQDLSFCEQNISTNETETKHYNSPRSNSSYEKEIAFLKPKIEETLYVQLAISDKEKALLNTYHQDFQKYKRNHSLYEEAIKPWLMVARIANNLIDSILEDVVLYETGIQKITSGLLQLEFQ